MPTLSVDDIIKKTKYTLFGSTTMPKAQRYSVGLEIDWRVPGFHPIEHVFYVHLDLIKREGSDEVYVDNHTPYQMISYRFWRWLEDSTTSDFMFYYLSKMYDIIHKEALGARM